MQAQQAVRHCGRRAAGQPASVAPRTPTLRRRRAACECVAAAPRSSGAPRRVRCAAASTDTAVVDERRVFSGVPLPPVGAKATQLVEVKPGLLWALRQDFPEAGPASIWLNCSVAKLSSGGLLVYSPVAPTPEMLDALRSLPGAVEHIVAPSMSPEHWLYVNATAAAFPDATVWVCPGLTEVNLPGIGDAKISAGPRVRTIGPDMTAALGGEVDFALFVGPLGLFKEAVLYARNARAIFSGDLFFGAFEDEGMPTALQRRIGGVVGIYKRIGCPVAFLQMLLKRDEGREWAAKVAGWDFDTATGGHLSAGINKDRYGVDGREAFMESFKFMLQ
ncbi:hypothetical protein Rsub_01263 [Raphidocelis subcapitata]|uniref:DUF4336 domain-containing protein n=1 Tax=Raphidocelis subcapitata TaxID=307507 RepID=A0A2V0NM46_9CHLO|nr:hypothetical protein Rsub_01263 [Raphidocelis subcapitata]|eukprot:GBF88548.1 hypothetical protein Rsub_01263 [Raphidocelis subcapitata]